MKYSRTRDLPLFSKKDLKKICSLEETEYLKREGIEIYISNYTDADSGEQIMHVREHYTIQDAELMENVKIKTKFQQYMNRVKKNKSNED